MTTARVLQFQPPSRPRSPDAEPVSPFRHAAERRDLTPRQVLHRQRMLAHLLAQRFTVVPRQVYR